MRLRYIFPGMLLLIGFLLVWLPIRGQTQQVIDSIRAHHPYSAMPFFPLPTFLPLDSSWQAADGQIYQQPFVCAGNSPQTIYYQFEVECYPDEELVLLFEGIAWRAELILNEVYVGVHEDPFSAWKVPLANEWIDFEGINQLEIRLSQGRMLSDYPRQFLGLFRPAHILLKSQVSAFTKVEAPADTFADRIAIVAPHFGQSGFVYNEKEAVRLLQPLIDEEIPQVFYPFAPDRRFRAFFQQYGIHEVGHIPDSVQILAINDYGIEPSALSIRRFYWFDLLGNRTADYGSFFPSRSNGAGRTTYKGRFLLSLMMLFPLIGLFAIKLLSPGFFHSMGLMLSKPKLFIDSFADSTYANLGLVILLMAIKTLLLAILISLMVYYIQLEYQWQILNIWKEWSLASWIFYGAGSLSAIFLRSLMLICCWLLFQYLLLSGLGGVFRLKGVVTGMLNLDIVSSFPLILLLTIPMSFIFFMESLWGGVLLGLILIMALGYILRRLYVFYIGLDRLFALSFGAKILYICTFNILPYIIWF